MKSPTQRSTTIVEQESDPQALHPAVSRTKQATAQQTSRLPKKLAIVCGVMRPYRLAFHQRIVREIPQLELHTMILFEKALVPVGDLDDPAIRSQQFGKGESVREQGKLKAQRRAWQKGGEVIAELRAKKIDAVMLVGYGDLAFVRVLRYCRKNNIRCFLWLDSNILGERSSGMKGFCKHRYLRWFMRQVTGTMVCGRLGQRYVEHFGGDVSRCHFVPYEPDYKTFQQVDAKKVAIWLDRLETDGARRRIVYCGRFHPRKRVDLALDAFLRIAHDRPDWDFVLVGQGDLESRLREMVPAELAHRVKWFPFATDQEELAALYHACDVLVLPSDYEAWALVVNEAVAAGLALVTSDVVGAAYELVIPGVNGEQFAKGNVDELTTKLRIITDLQQIDRYKQASGDVLRHWREIADPVNGLRQALMQE